MNQKRKSPTEPMLQSESPDTRDRLDQLEKRLKATRPRSPQLDLASLQRMANAATSGAMVELAPDRKPLPILHRDKGRIVGRALLITSSWVCGAGVGALVMFVLMSRTAVPPDPIGPIVHIHQERPQPIADEAIVDPFVEQRDSDQRDEVPETANPTWPDFNRSMLTMGHNPLRQWESSYLSDGPTLQVGMYLGRHGERRVDRTNVKRREYTGQPTGSTHAPESESPVSRRELMQEFLGVCPDTVRPHVRRFSEAVES